MDYMSTLETLESFWMALSSCSEHQIGASTFLYPLFEVSKPGIAHGSQQGALFSLSQLLSIPCRWITEVLWRSLKVSGILYPCVSHTESDLWRSSNHWLRLALLGIAHGSQQCALFTLSQLLRVPYGLIRRVL